MENSLPIHTPPCDRACADAYRWEVSASDLFAVLDETLLRRLDGSSDRGARGDAGAPQLLLPCEYFSTGQMFLILALEGLIFMFKKAAPAGRDHTPHGED